MSTRLFKIAALQPIAVPGDLAGNLARIEPLFEQAVERGARLVLTSESSLTAYDHGGVAKARAITRDDPVLDRAQDLAARNNATLVVGFFERAGDVKHNTCAVLHPDGRRVFQRKGVASPVEAAWPDFREGERRREIFEVDGFRFALLICADAALKGIHDELRDAGCDAILAPTAGCGKASEWGLHQHELANPERRKLFVERSALVCHPAYPIEQAVRLNVAYVACNQLGYDAATNYFHPGHSMIVDRNGDVTGLIPGKIIFEHQRPEFVVGFITKR